MAKPDTNADPQDGSKDTSSPEKPLTPLERLGVPASLHDHRSTAILLQAWESFDRGDQSQTRKILAPLLSQTDPPEIQKAAQTLHDATSLDKIHLLVGGACALFFFFVLYQVY